METLKDWRGQAIEVGDTILYPVKHSTFVEVNEAVVKSFGETDSYWQDPTPTIQVEWIKSSDGDFSQRYRKVKTVTLTVLTTVTVISKGK